MSVSLASLKQPSAACSKCGWVEAPEAIECRSCGASLSGAKRFSYTPSSAPPPLILDGSQDTYSPFSTPAPFPISHATGARPHFLISSPKNHYWLAFTTLLFHRWSLVLGLIAATSWYFFTLGPITHPPGILIKEEPLQGPVPLGQGFWKVDSTSIRALASYKIKARVLLPERYFMDPMADLSPIDLGVGWGIMSDETNTTKCQFSNSRRYLSWFWADPDFPAAAATPCMSNMHMLPANDRVRDRLLSLRVGQLFHADGYLVEVLRPSMNPWTSSLSRLDTGNGACEIMWVQNLTLLP